MTEYDEYFPTALKREQERADNLQVKADRLAEYFIKFTQGDDSVLEEAYDFLYREGYVDEVGNEL